MFLVIYGSTNLTLICHFISLLEKFYEHIQDAKLKIQEGLYNEALASYIEAESIHSSEKLKQKITKLTVSGDSIWWWFLICHLT